METFLFSSATPFNQIPVYNNEYSYLVLEVEWTKRWLWEPKSLKSLRGIKEGIKKEGRNKFHYDN